MSGVNAERGEAALEIGGEVVALRPSFGALVAAEAELGPLFDLVERAADGKLSLRDMAALFWHAWSIASGWTGRRWARRCLSWGWRG